MIFSSFLFLFLFLPIVLVINRFLPLKTSNLFLLIASLFFYFSGEGFLTILLVGSILWNYAFGLLLNFKKENTSLQKTVLGIGVTGNLLLLLYYKYFGFLIESTGLAAFIPEGIYADIALPIGISFFTFQGISYIIDVYRRVQPAEKSPVKLGLYIAFFPQLIAGPIVKFNEIAQYLSKRSIHLDQTTEGTFKFIRGLAKKVILANNFALLADYIFTADIHTLPAAVAWLGVLAYSLQIYYDFSGYSDMAIGLGLIMGFKIPENFEHPYIAKSIREFWQRWHISLSTWFKNYLYIPLGGNRKGAGRTYLNLILVFLVTGMWHGASYNFIIWGMLHGAFLILERSLNKYFPRVPQVFQHLYTLLVVSLAWVFFRIASFSEAIDFIGRLFSFSNTGDFFPIIYLNPYGIALLLISILLATPLRSYLAQRFSQLPISSHLNLVLTCTVYLLLFMYCILELSIATHDPFIYFKF